MATEGGTDGRAGADGRRSGSEAVTPDDADNVRYVSTEKPKKKKTPNVNVTAYFLIQHHHASLQTGQASVLCLALSPAHWGMEWREGETEVVMSG